MTAYDIIIKPIITERSMDEIGDKKYTFKVLKESNKTQIKSAVKQIWTFTNHGFQETCVLNEGFKCYPYSTAVEILIKLTITEA